jgi:hypothetical protein
MASTWIGRKIETEDAHCFAYVAEQCAWLAYLDSLVETPPSRADEPLGIVIDFSDGVSCVEIRVITFKDILITRDSARRIPVRRTLVIHTDI